VERDKPKKSESVEQTLSQLPWKQKRRDFEGLKQFKMAAVAMVTKVQKMLNSLQTVDPFET
jgi:hypothetical protein